MHLAQFFVGSFVYFFLFAFHAFLLTRRIFCSGFAVLFHCFFCQITHVCYFCFFAGSCRCRFRTFDVFPPLRVHFYAFWLRIVLILLPVCSFFLLHFLATLFARSSPCFFAAQIRWFVSIRACSFCFFFVVIRQLCDINFSYVTISKLCTHNFV